MVFLPGWDNISSLNDLLTAQQMFRSGTFIFYLTVIGFDFVLHKRIDRFVVFFLIHQQHYLFLISSRMKEIYRLHSLRKCLTWAFPENAQVRMLWLYKLLILVNSLDFI